MRWSLEWSEGGRVLASGGRALYGQWVLLCFEEARLLFLEIGAERGLAPRSRKRHGVFFHCAHAHGAAVSPTDPANGHVWLVSVW